MPAACHEQGAGSQGAASARGHPHVWTQHLPRAGSSSCLLPFGCRNAQSKAVVAVAPAGDSPLSHPLPSQGLVSLLPLAWSSPRQPWALPRELLLPGETRGAAPQHHRGCRLHPPSGHSPKKRPPVPAAPSPTAAGAGQRQAAPSWCSARYPSQPMAPGAASGGCQRMREEPWLERSRHP